MTLVLRNRQRLCRIDSGLLRKIVRSLLQEHFHAKQFELGLHLVEAPEMTQLNKKFLGLAGSTDVITFDYGEPAGCCADIRVCRIAGFRPAGPRPGGTIENSPAFQRRVGASKCDPVPKGRLKPVQPTHPALLAGEIFICVTEAQIQAQRYRTNLTSELVRYLIHGLLHLRGYADRTPALRRKMKREEDRLLGEISKHFPLKSLVNCGRSADLQSA